jgi:hypothetical protein
MITYHSQLDQRPSAVQQIANDAKRPLSVSPYAGQNHQDVFQAMGQRQSASLDSLAQQSRDAYEVAYQQQQRDSALAGLNMMAQGQQQANNLQQSRGQMLLRGLL